MAAIILPSRRAVQPQGPVELNFAGPSARFASGALLAASAANEWRNIAHGALGKEPTTVDVVTPVATSQGLGQLTAGGGRRGRNYTGLSASLTTFSISAVVQFAGLSGTQVITGNDSLNVGGIRLELNSSRFTLTHIGVALVPFGPTLTAGVYYSVVLSRNAATNQLIYSIANLQSGAVSHGSVTDTATFKDPTNPFWPIGYGRADTESVNGVILQAAISSAAISQAEAIDLSRNPWQLFRPIQRRIIVIASAGGGDITGTLAATLANLTASAAGQSIIAGTAAKTLDAATVAASGTVGSTAANGSASITLGAATLSGAGAVQAAGTASVTLAGMTAAGAGAVRATGAAASTLGAMTAAAVGTVRVSGSAAPALADATLSAAGGIRATGSASSTLAPATLVATGVLPVAGAANGSLNATLAPAAVSGAGTTRAAGTLARTLDGATLAAAGAVRASGQAGATLGGLQLVAAGGVLTEAGAAIVLEGMTAAAAGGTVVVGELDASLGDMALVADGYAGDGNRGFVNATLGDAELVAAGVLLFGFTPSAARTLRVPGEDRRQVVKAETRTVTIEPEQRTYKVA